MKDKQLRSYLLWAFLLAWILQAVAIGLTWAGQAQLFRPVVALSMFAPLAAALLAKIPVKDMGWHLRLTFLCLGVQVRPGEVGILEPLGAPLPASGGLFSSLLSKLVVC